MEDFKTIGELFGKKITGLQHSAEEVIIDTECGKRYRMWHPQDCCEHVRLDKIEGVVGNILGSPVVVAQEGVERPDSPEAEGYESVTFTNFTIGTESAEITLKWIGSSNGYYGESVYFELMS